MRTAQVVALLVLLAARGAAGSAERALLAPLADQAAIEGCSWSASSPGLGPGAVFVAELDDAKILMNIGGQDVELQLAGEQGNLGEVGAVQTKRFRAPGIDVVARFQAEWVCPADDESCEVTRYDVEFDVSHGQRRQLVRGTGDVGC